MPTQPTSPSHREFNWNGFGDVSKDMLVLVDQLGLPEKRLLQQFDLHPPSSSKVVTICNDGKNIIY